MKHKQISFLRLIVSCIKYTKKGWFIKNILTKTYQKDVSKFLDLYENKLKLRQFLISDNVSLADIALMPFIRQCAFVDIDWFNTKFVYLKKWLNKWIDSDLFTKIMVKHETWDDSTVSQIL